MYNISKDAETYLVFRTLKKLIPEKLNLRPLYSEVAFCLKWVNKIQGSRFHFQGQVLYALTNRILVLHLVQDVDLI